jgi:hypothetical protein
MEPTVENSYVILGWALLCLGRNGEAVNAMEPHFGSVTAFINRGTLGYAFARAGRRADAVRILHELEEELAEHAGSSRAIAWVHTGLGNHDEAITSFQAAIRAREFGVNQDFRLFVSEDLQSLPGFGELLRQVRLEP